MPVDKGVKLREAGGESSVVFGDVGGNELGGNTRGCIGSGRVSRLAGGFGQGASTRCGADEHPEISRTVASDSVRIGQVLRFGGRELLLRLRQARGQFVPALAGGFVDSLLALELGDQSGLTISLTSSAATVITHAKANNPNKGNASKAINPFAKG